VKLAIIFHVFIINRTYFYITLDLLSTSRQLKKLIEAFESNSYLPVKSWLVFGSFLSDLLLTEYFLQLVKRNIDAKM